MSFEKKSIQCFFCEKQGHRKSECFGYAKWKKNQEKKDDSKDYKNPKEYKKASL